MPVGTVHPGPPGRSGVDVEQLGRMIGGLARACHLGPTLAVTALVTTVAVGAGADQGRDAPAGAAVLTGQLSVGWSNDWIDAERDLAVGRRDKPILAGAVPTRVVRAGALFAAALCVPLSLATGWRAGFAHLVAVAAAWGTTPGSRAPGG